MKFKNVSCRTVLYWMILSGTCLSYMLKVSLNVVVAGIANRPSEPSSEVQCKEWLNQTSVYCNESMNSTIMNEFSWSEYEQGLMMSAYYWLHPIMEIPGGILAKKYGTKIVFGIGLLVTLLLGYILPLATKYHPYANISIRVLQGVAAGTAYPSMHNLTANWVPQNERSRFVSAYGGTSIAVTITYAVSGYIIHYLGWESVFYISSSLGILWVACWWYLVYDSPIQHPRIMMEEKDYILQNIGKSRALHHGDTLIPWREILTCVPLWANIINNWGTSWGFYTLSAQGPNYFTFVHGWNIRKTGLLAGLPFLLTFIFSFIIGNICDWLIKRGKMSRTNVRKLASFICGGAPGLITIGLAYSGYNSDVALFFMFTGITLMGAISSGPLPNYIDLSPNFASVLLGIAGLIVNFSGSISPIVIGRLTQGNQTIGQWQLFFFICASIQIICCIVFLVWGSGDEQSWNAENRRNKKGSVDESIALNN